MKPLINRRCKENPRFLSQLKKLWCEESQRTVRRFGPTTATRGVQLRAMTQAIFPVIVAELSTATDGDRVSRRKNAYGPICRRQNHWR